MRTALWLENKPDFEQAMQRIEAWFAGEMLDRPPVRFMAHNVFHVDGKRIARHLDAILSVPQVHAIQWVQGVGDDQPIMQWTPLIRRLQVRGVPVIVDLSKHELDDFMAVMRPECLFLWISTDNTDEELAIIEKLLTWRQSKRLSAAGEA